MVKLIIGGTGSGKTKEIVDQVNAAVKKKREAWFAFRAAIS